MRVGAGLELLRPLGEGSMGSVWEAARPEGERVAVKFASRHVLKDPTDRARFSREATLANRLESAHVVHGHGFGIAEGGVPYIVMELLEGETLETRLRRERVIAPALLVTIVDQLAEALDEAHALGIVHRDLKPANLFLVDGHEGVFVKVLDFGMAKRTMAVNPTVVTEIGTSVGTPDYMSPEQVRSEKDIDHRSDIFSLGVLAYRALMGRLPFVSSTFAGLCVAICESRFVPPSELAPNFTAALDTWMKRALAVARDERFASAGEAADALAVALELRDPARPRFPSRASAAELRDELSADGLGFEELGDGELSHDELSHDGLRHDPFGEALAPPRRTGPLDVALAVFVSLAAFFLGALLASVDGF
ncbi:MAG: serine/threonine-protein kinase [Polyangiaceae bacterium]